MPEARALDRGASRCEGRSRPDGEESLSEARVHVDLMRTKGERCRLLPAAPFSRVRRISGYGLTL